MPESVFVWTVSDVFGLIVLGITAVGFVAYLGYSHFLRWRSNWRRRR